MIFAKKKIKHKVDHIQQPRKINNFLRTLAWFSIKFSLDSIHDTFFSNFNVRIQFFPIKYSLKKIAKNMERIASTQKEF